ncbi:MAG: NUDIX hydrolase [Flavobacteriales bacterium]
MNDSSKRLILDLTAEFEAHGKVFSANADAMMPFRRPRPEASDESIHAIRYAGVALPLFEVDGEWHLSLMKRTEYPGVHSGQISIPGGEREEGDADLKQTAMREFLEEMGVPLELPRLIDGLSERFIPPSNFLVKPFIHVMDSEPDWKIDPTEVQSVLTIPLGEFLKPDALRPTSISISPDQRVELPAYHWKGEVIWGATAIILTELTFAWKSMTENH